MINVLTPNAAVYHNYCHHHRLENTVDVRRVHSIPVMYGLSGDIYIVGYDLNGPEDFEKCFRAMTPEWAAAHRALEMANRGHTKIHYVEFYKSVKEIENGKEKSTNAETE